MAAAAAGPGAPHCPQTIASKGDAEKPEEELEGRKTTRRYLSAAGQRGLGGVGREWGCGIRVLRNLDERLSEFPERS